MDVDVENVGTINEIEELLACSSIQSTQQITKANQHDPQTGNETPLYCATERVDSHRLRRVRA